MKNKITLFIFLAAIILLNINILYGIETTKYNLSNFFRIHIVANSDNTNDQMLKLKITDTVNTYIKDITKNATDKNECVQLIQNNVYNILDLVNETQKATGYNYPIAIQLGNIKYDDKTYNKLHMDKGTYNSLRIVIGKGLGNNWWSLLYPSMPDEATTNDILLNEDIKFDSLILEWINKCFNLI